jgi:hypothetical protein
MGSWPIDRVDLALAIATPHHLRAPKPFVEKNIHISSHGKLGQPPWAPRSARTCRSALRVAYVGWPACRHFSRKVRRRKWRNANTDKELHFFPSSVFYNTVSRLLSRITRSGNLTIDNLGTWVPALLRHVRHRSPRARAHRPQKNRHIVRSKPQHASRLVVDSRL